MAGIYIHVPFCYKRCYYCDFYSSVNTRLVDGFVEVVQKELEERNGFFKEPVQIQTLYFGGGTPSLLSPRQLNHILDKLRNHFSISAKAEITIEVNPDDLHFEYLKALRDIGINRLSIGIQSFDDQLLKFMNRRHNAEQAVLSVEMAQKAGFSNISIDLIYGIPNLSIEMWEQALEKAFSLNVQHLSAYHLGIEKGTVFGKWLEKGKIKEINEEESWAQFLMLYQKANQADFEHYEISNLALKGYRSQHNTSYWNNIPYLGAGPSAHSFDGECRFWNIANAGTYIEALKSGKSYSENEKLTPENRRHEYIMTRLRTSEGIDLNQFEQLFGQNERQKLQNDALNFINNEYAVMTPSQFFLTLKGWFISDRIISELI